MNLRIAIRQLPAWILMLTALCSCTSDGYDTGDGRLSYLKSEFVVARTGSATSIHQALTDDNQMLNLSPVLTAAWADEPDTEYRALLNYKAHAEQSTQGSITVEPISISRVVVLEPKAPADCSDTHTDALGVESAWMSKNGKFINLRLALKTGEPQTDDQRQTVGLMLTDEQTDSQGHTTMTLQLLHNQNGVPQYYTVSTFVSIPTSVFAAGSTVRLNINTYDGEVQKVFNL